MLVEFRVENFRSIKKEVILSMVASEGKELESNLISNGSKESGLLRSAAILGQNASGKSNLLFALKFFKDLVVKSHRNQKGEELLFRDVSASFKLDEKYSKKPTKFGVVFIKDKTKYDYALSFNSSKIVAESLHYYSGALKKTVFERTKTKNFKFSVQKKYQEEIAKRTLENVLYLSKSVQESFDLTTPVFDWFKKDVLFISSYRRSMRYTINALSKEKRIKELVLKALSKADLNIDDFEIEDLPETSERNKLAHGIISIEQFNRMVDQQRKITVKHKGRSFDFRSEESTGTKRLFSLLGYWINALQKGRLILIDELDKSMHYFLTLFLIRLFHDKTQNKKNSQLIFTTHNIAFLDMNLFRKDQIWLIDKDPETGASDLYSLADFNEKEPKNIQSRYLLGKYGAVPLIKEELF